MSAHVAYDTKTGRIIAVHHGQVNKEHAHRLAANYAKIRQRTRSESEKIDEGQIAVISVALEDFNPVKQYKVDTERKTLVQTDKGIGLSISVPRTPKK